MPIQTPSPVVVQAAQSGNWFQIFGFRTMEPIAGQPSLEVYYGIGSKAADGTITWIVPSGIYALPPARIAAVAGQPPAGTTLRAAIKAALYAELQAAGIFPAGTVS